MRRLATVAIVALCVIGLLGSFVIRSDTAQRNCTNLLTLRDAMAQIVTLADENTPPSDSADKFYGQAQAELGKVTC